MSNSLSSIKTRDLKDAIEALAPLEIWINGRVQWSVLDFDTFFISDQITEEEGKRLHELSRSKYEAVIDFDWGYVTKLTAETVEFHHTVIKIETVTELNVDDAVEQ